MKLKVGFESVDMGDEIIMVPIGPNAHQIHGILKLNVSAREICYLLANDTNEEAIVNILSEKYENDEESLKKYVHVVVETLRKNGLLEE